MAPERRVRDTGMADDMMEDGAGGLDGGGRKKSRRLLLIIGAPVLLLIAAGAGLYFSGIAQVLLGKHEEVAKTDGRCGMEPRGVFEEPRSSAEQRG